MATETTGAAVGMPQLDVTIWPNLIFWALVTLVAVYFVLSRIALPRIGSVLADRKGVISNDLAAAEELKRKAVAAEKAYNEALASARADAARIVADARAEIQKELDAATAKADVQIAAKVADSEVRIGAIRDGALEAVNTVARDAADEIVSAFGGRADPAAIGAAVADRLKG